MELKFIGNGSAYHPAMGNTSAWFRKGGRFFLFDCGETVFRALMCEGALCDVGQAVVIITHMHADHCGSLPTLLSYLRYRMGVEVTVVYPDGERMSAFLQACGAGPDACALISGEGASEIDGVILQPVRVEHVGGMRCYGYVVHGDGETIFYSGDASSVPEEVLARFLEGEIQRIYVDCCAGPNRDHGELARHCAAIPPDCRNRVYCMHLSPEDVEIIRRHGFQIAGQEG